MTWDEIFEWMQVSADNEVWFSTIDEVDAAKSFIEKDGWSVIYAGEKTRKIISENGCDFLGLWFDTYRNRFVFSTRDQEEISDYDEVIFYCNYPFATCVNIDSNDLLNVISI